MVVYQHPDTASWVVRDSINVINTVRSCPLIFIVFQDLMGLAMSLQANYSTYL